MDEFLFNTAYVIVTCVFAGMAAVGGESLGAASKALSRFPSLLLDNSVHGLVAAACWAATLACSAVITPSSTRVASASAFSGSRFLPVEWTQAFCGPIAGEATVQICIAYVLGCALDVDHFIPALGGQPSLDGAMRLGQRPAGHAVLAVIIASGLAAALWRRTPLWALVFVAWGTHQLRDSIRRGLWLWPSGSTRAVPFRLYVLSVAILPLLMAVILLCSGYGSPVGAFTSRSSSSSSWRAVAEAPAAAAHWLRAADAEAATSAAISQTALNLGSPSLRNAAASNRLRIL